MEYHGYATLPRAWPRNSFPGVALLRLIGFSEQDSSSSRRPQLVLPLLARMNNNLTTERSHLGVFSTTSYITVGDQYGKKSESDPRLKGKQFTADFPKSGVAGARPNNSMFDREHKWLYGGEKCVACSSPPHSNRGQARPPDGSQALFSQGCRLQLLRRWQSLPPTPWRWPLLYCGLDPAPCESRHGSHPFDSSRS